MANLSISLKTQVMYVFGPSPATDWNSFKWGSGTWGMKSAGSGGTPSMAFTFYKIWTKTNTFSATDQVVKRANKNWSGNNQITLSYADTDKEQYDSAGYHYVFAGNVTNAADEFFPSFSCGSVASVTYTSNTVTATTWT